MTSLDPTPCSLMQPGWGPGVQVFQHLLPYPSGEGGTENLRALSLQYGVGADKSCPCKAGLVPLQPQPPRALGGS